MTHTTETTAEISDQARSAIESINWKQLYTSFEGRITRRSYWFGMAGIAAASAVLQSIVFTVVNYSDVAIASTVASLTLVYPLLAVGAKRFHDRGKTGWMQIVFGVPILGALWVLSTTGVCPSISTGTISCATPEFKALASFSMTVVLLSVFTGVPVLFAGVGFLFLLHDYFLWNSMRKMKKLQLASPTKKLHQPSFIMFLLKSFGILMGIAVVAGAATGA